MARKETSKSGSRDELWADAKRRCRLSREDVRMAKELGLNPRSLIKNMPSKDEPWKLPVKEWIRELHRKRGEKAERKRVRRTEPMSDGSVPAATAASAAGLQSESLEPNPDLPEELSLDADPDWEDADGAVRKKAEEENRFLLLRRDNFRLAAEGVARELAKIPSVCKVSLFGSVAVPLRKEIPRYRKYRRAGIALWHGCKDVDLAVWVSDCDDLRSLQKARSRAVGVLWRDRQVGVAHHQVEIFLIEPETDRYLGRLCNFAQCPKGKPECLVPGCGESPFLRQHCDFVLRADALAPDRAVVLFERDEAIESPTEDETVD